MSSKYGSLRDEQAGPCRTFLKRTAKYHDRTMEHPLMQSIYDKKITDSAYVLYLQGMYELFAMLEAPDALKVLPASLVDGRLNRMTAIEQDLQGLGAHTDPAVRQSSSAIRRYFAELLQPEQLQSANQMICHHFLHYNAMLSGGMILGACLRQMNKPTALYGFQLQDSSGKVVPCHQYVRDYMQRLDKCVASSDDLEPMVQTMVQIYELTEELMNEAQALQPTVVRPVAEKRVIAPTPEAFVPRITLKQLRATDGTNGSKLWLSIGGRVLDATGSSSYAPGGPYHLFAGHDISRALSEMSLNEDDLDDLDYDCNAAEGCATWATKLGRCYAPVGTLAEFTESKLLSTGLFLYDPSAPKLERPSDSETQQQGQETQKCPLTGAEGASCPLGFGAPSQPAGESGEECPFPFIFLHDPERGWELHARKAKIGMSCTIAVVAMYFAFLGFATS